MKPFKPPMMVRKASVDGNGTVVSTTTRSDRETARPVKRARSDPFASVVIPDAPGNESFLVPAVPVPKRAKTTTDLNAPKKDAFRSLMAKHKLAKSVQAGMKGDFDYVFRNVFGKTAYKGKQKEIMEWAVEGKDVLVIAPTGMGKSMCFQVPALAVSHGLTLVIGPLISLMADQVRALKELEIPAEMLTSKTTKAAQRAIYKDMESGHPRNRLLYVTPERLASPHFNKRLKILYDQKELSRLVIDEAHCISEWGHDFRPDYAKLGNFRTEYPSVPIMALTASATGRVQQDIVSQLRFDNEKLEIAKHGVNRPNLFYEIRYFSESEKGQIWKMQDLLGFLKKKSVDKATGQQIATAGIIYCRAKHTCDEVAEFLRAHGICAGAYHRGLKDTEASYNQDLWINNVELAKRGKPKVDCIVATIAFGMGIDKPDCRYVIHYDIPKSFEGFYQETGRAGRDDLSARCIMYFSLEDAARAKSLVDRGHLSRTKRGEQGRGMMPSQRAPDSIDALLKFAKSASKCRHESICDYFGDPGTDEADDRITLCDKMCDVCNDGEKTRRKRKEGLVDLDDSLATQIAASYEPEDEEELDPYGDYEIALSQRPANAILDDSSGDDDDDGGEGESKKPAALAGFQSAAALFKKAPVEIDIAPPSRKNKGKQKAVEDDSTRRIDDLFRSTSARIQSVDTAEDADDEGVAGELEFEETEREPLVANGLDEPVDGRDGENQQAEESDMIDELAEDDGPEETGRLHDTDEPAEETVPAIQLSEDEENENEQLDIGPSSASSESGEDDGPVEDAIEREQYPDEEIPEDVLFEDDADDEEAAAQLLQDVIASQMPRQREIIHVSDDEDDDDEEARDSDTGTDNSELVIEQVRRREASVDCSDEDLPELAKRNVPPLKPATTVISQKLNQSGVRMHTGTVISNANGLNGLAKVPAQLGALSSTHVKVATLAPPQQPQPASSFHSSQETSSQQQRAIDEVQVSPMSYDKKIPLLLRRKTVMHLFKWLKRKMMPSESAVEFAASQAVWADLKCDSTVDPADRMKVLRRAAEDVESDLFWLCVTQAGYTRGVSQRTAALGFLLDRDASETNHESKYAVAGFSARQILEVRREVVDALERSVDFVLPHLKPKKRSKKSKGEQKAG